MQENMRRDRSHSRFPDGFRILKGEREYVTYIENSSLRVWYADTPWSYEPHFHSAVEIIMPIRGEVVYTVSDFSYRVQADEVLIIPANWEHSLTMGEGSARYLFLFEPDTILAMRDMPLIEDLVNIPIYLSGQPEVQGNVRALLMQIADCYEKRAFMWNMQCYSLLLQIYAKLGQLNAFRENRRPLSRNGTDPEIIDSARLYIDQYYMRSISLDDVSAFTGFTKSYFSRLFKRQVGQGFSEYLRQKRVNIASDLLMRTNQPIKTIAVNVGFGSIATFNRVFHEIKNCAPSEYRKIYGSSVV